MKVINNNLMLFKLNKEKNAREKKIHNVIFIYEKIKFKYG